MFGRDVWASIIYYVVDGNIVYSPEDYARFMKSHPFDEPEHYNVRGISGWSRTWAEWWLQWLYFVLQLPSTLWNFFFQIDARGAARFNLLARYLNIVSFGIHCIFKYTISQQGDLNVHAGDDDSVRQSWHNDFVGHNGALHVFYRPVNDMRVLLPLVVCIIVAWIQTFFFLMGGYWIVLLCIFSLMFLIYYFLCPQASIPRAPLS